MVHAGQQLVRRVDQDSQHKQAPPLLLLYHLNVQLRGERHAALKWYQYSDIRTRLWVQVHTRGPIGPTLDAGTGYPASPPCCPQQWMFCTNKLYCSIWPCTFRTYPSMHLALCALQGSLWLCKHRGSSSTCPFTGSSCALFYSQPCYIP